MHVIGITDSDWGIESDPVLIPPQALIENSKSLARTVVVEGSTAVAEAVGFMINYSESLARTDSIDECDGGRL
ncbi:hypothetical protein L2E82_34540 [Cichorium intybus]|uniref:Uncharacterized protein n=1 Tax=Cichorium intybus TaxID=13427 RepID=A0ACB9BM93_CICIN|nr:hypothetical protein L2E82_34540 [Cichorium intybus]